MMKWSDVVVMQENSKLAPQNHLGNVLELTFITPFFYMVDVHKIVRNCLH